MIKRVLTIITVLLCLSACSMDTTMPLQTTLETHYQKVRQAILDKNYHVFMELVEPLLLPGQDPLTEEQFHQAYDYIVDLYIDLDSDDIRFITIQESHGWQIYYYQADIHSDAHTVVGMFFFRQQNNQWKMSGHTQSHSFGGEVLSEQAILGKIAEDKNLQIPEELIGS